MIKSAFRWIVRMLEEPDGTPSTKRMLFALTVFTCLVFAAGVMVARGNIEDKVVDLLKWTLAATGGGYAIGRFAESADKKCDDPDDKKD